MEVAAAFRMQPAGLQRARCTHGVRRDTRIHKDATQEVQRAASRDQEQSIHKDRVPSKYRMIQLYMINGILIVPC